MSLPAIPSSRDGNAAAAAPTIVWLELKIFRINDIDVVTQSFSMDLSWKVWWTEEICKCNNGKTATAEGKCVDCNKYHDVSKETKRGVESPHQVNIKNSADTKDVFGSYLTQYPMSMVMDEPPEVLQSGESRKASKERPNIGNFRFMERKVVLLQAPVVLHDFPFDRQDLLIKLRLPRTHDKNNILRIYEVEFEGRFEVPEWRFFESQIFRPLSAKGGRKEPVDDLTEIQVKVPASRNAFNYVCNYGGLMCLLTTVCGYVFVLDVDMASERSAITTTMLLTSVAFKFLVGEKLPSISYLTLLDKYIIICFLIQLLIIFENALVSVIDNGSDVDRIFYIVLGSVWALSHIILMVFGWEAHSRVLKGYGRQLGDTRESKGSKPLYVGKTKGSFLEDVDSTSK